MKIEYILLAEAVAQDTRGATTLVGVNQDIFAPDSLPAHTKRVIFARISEISPGKYSMRAELLDPQRKAMAIQTGQIDVGDRPLPDLPGGGIDLPVEFEFLAASYGTHSFSLEMTAASDGTSAAAAIQLHVVSPRQLRGEEQLT